MTDGCHSYCDDHCDRPEGHDGLCWGQFSDQVWRDATDAEIAAFKAELETRLADGPL